MRTAVAYFAALLAAACGDPRIDVEVVLPSGFDQATRSVNLQLLVPPVASPFDCEAVEFDEVSDLAIQLSLIQEIAFAGGAGGGELTGIPREGQKLFLATALDAAGKAIALGCAEHGAVDGDAQVRVVMVARPFLGLPSHPFDTALPAALDLPISDAFDQPLDEVDVRWLVVGPGGEELAGSTSTDRGLARIVPERPTLPGPVALDVRARWLRNRPPSMVGFQRADDETWLVPGDSRSFETAAQRSRYVVGRVGPAGQLGFAALGPVARREEARQVLVGYYDPAIEGFRTGAGVLPPESLALGLLPAGGRDRIVTIAPGEWLEIAPPDGSGLVQITSESGPSSPAIAIAPIGPCDGGEGAAILVQHQDQTLAAWTGPGQVVSSPFDDFGDRGSLTHSGCVGDTDGSVHRVVVFQMKGQDQTFVSAHVNGQIRHGFTPANAVTVGFTPALENSPPLLLAHSPELLPVIARHLIEPTGTGGLALVEVDSDPTVLSPLSTVGADLDGDGVLDVAGLFLVGLEGEEQVFRTGVNLGVEHRGARLFGQSPIQRATSPQLFAADFDGDGRDDLLIATPFDVTVFLMLEQETEAR